MSGKRDLLDRSHHAAIFRALGDETRLQIISKLTEGLPLSIVQLTDGTGLTRQAVTKHLKVLRSVGLVQSIQAGRESLYELNPAPFTEVRKYLEWISNHWDERLSRLKKFVEA